MAGDMTFESAIKAFFEYQMRNVYTAIPAQIVQVRDAGQHKVDVKPLVNMVFPDWEDDQEWPTILSVPLMYPASSTSAFTFPVKAGDTVLLVFNQSCIDVFKSGDGTAAPPSDYRVFNMRDAVAVPGLFPFGTAINQPSKHTLIHSTDDAVLVHNLGTSSECEVRLKNDGKVEINGNLLDISSTTEIDGNLINTGSVTVGVGATGSFTTPLGQIVTVTDGIITNIF
jgi:hypothetical protein